MGSMFVAQVIMLIFGLLIIKPFVRITRINKVYLNLAVLIIITITGVLFPVIAGQIKKRRKAE